MNASYAKKPLSQKTISEMISYVAISLGLKLDIGKKFPSQWHKFMSYCIDLKTKVIHNTPLQLKSYIAMIEYKISVHGIYIERLINKNWKLDRKTLIVKRSYLDMRFVILQNGNTNKFK